MQSDFGKKFNIKFSSMSEFILVPLLDGHHILNMWYRHVTAEYCYRAVIVISFIPAKPVFMSLLHRQARKQIPTDKLMLEDDENEGRYP